MGNQQAAAAFGAMAGAFVVVAMYAGATVVAEEKAQDLTKDNGAKLIQPFTINLSAITIARIFAIVVNRKYSVMHVMRRRWDWYTEDMPRLKRLIKPNVAAIEKVINQNKIKTKEDVFEWIVCNIEWKKIYSRGAYFPEETIEMGEGICLEFCSLAVSMLRAIGYGANRVWIIGGYPPYDKEKKVQPPGHAYLMIDNIC